MGIYFRGAGRCSSVKTATSHAEKEAVSLATSRQLLFIERCRCLLAARTDEHRRPLRFVRRFREFQAIPQLHRTSRNPAMVLSRTTNDDQPVCSDDRGMGIAGILTGVKKLSATKRALAFNYMLLALEQVSVHALKAILTNSFISEISLSTSSINCMMKSTSLCFNISSVWKLVIKNEMS